MHVTAYTEIPQNLTEFRQLFGRRDEGAWSALESVEFQRQHDKFIANVNACEDRTAAESFRHLEIGVRRRDMPTLPSGEFYWVDLQGLSVLNADDVKLGNVTNIVETGASTILDVSGEKGRYLIPFVEANVEAVDLSSHIRVRWHQDWLA